MTHPDTGQLVNDLTFASEFAQPILSGEKTVTARLDDEHGGVFDGDELRLLTEDGETIADATVKRAKTLPATEAYDVLNLHSGHKSYGSLSGFLEAMQGYYPDTLVGEETKIRLIHFEVSY